jgi:hypothetical protein
MFPNFPPAPEIKLAGVPAKDFVAYFLPQFSPALTELVLTPRGKNKMENFSSLHERRAKHMANEDVNLSALLREVETEYFDGDGDVEDMKDLRSRLVAAVGVYRTSRYRLGETLYAYRTALPHGAWTPVVEAIATASHLTDRTIREILSDYERVRETPAPVVQALQQVGIDPAAKRQEKIVEMAVDSHKAGTPPAEAVEAAVALTRRPVAPVGLSSSDAPLTQDQRWILSLRENMRKTLGKIPPDRRVEVFRAAAAEELWFQVSSKEPITIVPTKPTLDLVGRRRSA